jgi:hypothetical protein
MRRSASRRLLDQLTVVLLLSAWGCVTPPDTTLERLTESRRLAADLLVQLSKAADAANRAVMADTDEAATAATREDGQAIAATEKDMEALRPALQQLGFTAEGQLLDQFAGRFAEYRRLDRTIVDLAAENTNLKAQRISFGPASQAAEACVEALTGLAPSTAADTWRLQALAATVVASVREVQALQAPHIAEADDAAMTGLEQRMAASAAAARKALQSLAPVVAATARPRLIDATTALDRFMTLNAELVVLSRRNSNVKSLALSLGQKRMLTAACEESLQALQDALGKRGFAATR